METTPLLQTEGLKKYFPIKGRAPWERSNVLKAVDGIDFSLSRGETIGIVGESGCGKSTLGQCLLMLEKPTSGSVWYNGRDLTKLKNHELRPLRGKLQIVFQDPYSSLDPHQTIRSILSEPLKVQLHLGNISSQEIPNRINALMDMVGLDRYMLNSYPHEFSGGQRQRVCIARAFASSPELVICDEAVSALDVSVQAQIINLLQDLKESTGVSYLFISHDLSVVRHISDRIMVLYLGKVLEMADRHRLFEFPAHPYTRLLLSSIPQPDPDRRNDEEAPETELPSPFRLPGGCRFETRCPYSDGKRCREEEPALQEVAPGHLCACHYGKEFCHV